MGKVEKIVVLSVLFLIAVILAVSLDTGGGDDVQAAGRKASTSGSSGGASKDVELNRADRLSAPLDIPDERDEGPVPSRTMRDRDQRQLDPVEPVIDTTDEPVTDVTSGSGALLNAAVGGSRDRDPRRRRDPSEESSAPLERQPDPEPPATEQQGDLLTLVNLRDTVSADLKLYSCQDGDTFKKIAARYYGDGVKAELLRRYNEGVRELTAGHELFVPVYDDGYGAQAEYEVLDGENLWAIAKKVYGKGHLWNEIWEANKDRLKNPDAVRAGVVLRIP